ncbi:MAG: cation transporter [Thermoanaerobaculaceae bacterium]|nr:cation transporter [Thermoanaerobaculaceae bacterium]
MTSHSHIDRPLYITVFLNGFISLLELFFGLISNSLALISDAAHNLTDFLAVFLALISRIAGRKPPTLKHTYGFRRLEIFAAFFNGLLLFAIMAILLKESIFRLFNPVKPPSQTIVIVVGIAAFFVNFISVIVLNPHKKEDVNIKIAFIHLLQDAFVSVVVIISAFLYNFSFGKYVDPIATILISILVLKSAILILYETVLTLLEGVPPNIDIMEIINFVGQNYPQISIHHIHIWQNGPNEILLTAHIHFKENCRTDEIEMVFADLKEKFEKQWKINHITFEPEFNGCGESETISKGISKGTKF